MDKKQMVHDLALIHAQAKYEEFFSAVPPEKRPFQSDINELIGFYKTAVSMLANHADELEDAYLDDDGSPIL